MWLPRKAAYTVQYDGNAASEEHVVFGHDQIQCMIEDFGRYVLNNEPVWPAPEEAIKSARVMDALLTSAREKRCVKV